MKFTLILILAGILFVPVSYISAGSSAIDAKTPVATISDESWGSTILGGGVKTNGSFTEGSLFMTQPLWDTIAKGGKMGGSLLLLEPYGTWGQGGEAGGSLGLVFRHLFSDQSVQDARTNQKPGFFTEGAYVGANLFMDYDHTELGSNFWQIGVGAEAGTRYFEVRGNYYIPTSNENFLGRHTDTFRRSSHRSTTSTTLGAPFVDGSGNTVQDTFRTTRNLSSVTTTKRVTEFFEEPLQGWDLEMSFLIPRIDRFADVRLVGAYYSYQGDFSHVADVSGWRSGVEIRPVKSMVLSAMWYEKNQLYRDHWLVGVRFEIPLGKPASQNFSSGYRPLADRLYEPARRKNSAVTSSGVESTTTTSTSTSSSSSSTTTTSQNILSTPPPPPPIEQLPEG